MDIVGDVKESLFRILPKAPNLPRGFVAGVQYNCWWANDEKRVFLIDNSGFLNYGYNIYQILSYIYRHQGAARSVVIVVRPLLLEGATGRG